MSFILGRTFNSYAKGFISERISSLTTFSCLSSVNYNGRINSNSNQTPYRKILQPVQVHQHRYFSIDFNDSLYQPEATSEATKLVIDLLIRFHDLSGLHWWSTLIAAPVLLKSFYSIPCTIYQQKLIAKTELIKIQSKPLIVNLKHEVLIEGRQKRWTTEKVQKNFKKEVKKLMQKTLIDNNIHPFKIVILSLIQIPPWVLMTMSLSKFSRDVSSGNADSVAAAHQFKVGGPFWCPDLSVPDSTCILSIMLFLFSLSSFEMNRILKRQDDVRLTRILNSLSRFFVFLLFIISLKVSSGLSLFWTSNAAFGIATNLLLFSPRVRRLLRIPKTPSELEKPYTHLAEEMRNKWNNLLKRK